MSLDLLQVLQRQRVDSLTGVAALAMTLGRLSSRQLLDEDQEKSFIQDIIDWTSSYWVEGEC